MFQFRKYKQVLYSWPMVIFLLIVVFIAGRASWQIYEKEQTTEEKLATVQQEHQELKQRHAEMKEEVSRLQTKRGQTAAMRKRFGVTKENERVVYIIDQDSQKSATTTEDTTTFLQSLLSLFGL